MIELIDLRALRPPTRGLVLVGSTLMLVTAWLAATGGLPVPHVLLGGVDRPVTIPLPSYLLIVVLMTCGWAYLVTGSLGCARRVRLPVLAAVSALFVVSTLVDVLTLGGVALILEGAGLILLLAIVWASRLFARGRGISVRVVVIGVSAFATYFVLSHVTLRPVGAVPIDAGVPLAALGAPVLLTLVLASLAAMVPMYLYAGSDTSQLLHWSARTLTRVFERALPRGPWAALAAGALALGSVALVRPATFGDARVLPYSALWLAATLAFLRFAVRRSRARSEPHAGVVLALAVGLTLAVAVLSSAPAAVNAALAVLGAFALAASLILLRRPTRHGGSAVLLGLIGVWTLFLDVPQVLAPDTRSADFFGIVDPVAIAALACVAVAVAGERSPTVASLRGPVALSTIALLGVSAYITIMLEKTATDVIPAVQLAALLILGLWGLPGLPRPLRLASAAAIAGGLGVAVVAGATGDGASARIAQAMLLAVGLLWEYAASGSFTNVDGAVMPREPRVLMHLGYSLAALATVVFFADVRGSGSALEPNAIAAIGLAAFGLPYVIYRGYAAARTAAAHAVDVAADTGRLAARPALGPALAVTLVLAAVTGATLATMPGLGAGGAGPERSPAPTRP